MSSNLNLTLKVWRQGGASEKGAFETYQLSDVARPLFSFGECCDEGNRMILETKGGYINHLSTGTASWFPRQGQVYDVPSWVNKKHPQEADFSEAGRENCIDGSSAVRGA